MTNSTDLVWHPTDDQATDQPAPPPAGFEYDTPMGADRWEDQFEPVGTMPVVGDRICVGTAVGTVVSLAAEADLAYVRMDGWEHLYAYAHSYWRTPPWGGPVRRVYKRKPDTSTLPATEAEKPAIEATKPAKRDILTEAKARLGIKDDQHGPAEHSFPLIAALWSEYLGTKVSPVDVSAMMILLKCARAKHGHGTFDTWLDIIGYSVCGQQMVDG